MARYLVAVPQRAAAAEEALAHASLQHLQMNVREVHAEREPCGREQEEKRREDPSTHGPQ